MGGLRICRAAVLAAVLAASSAYADGEDSCGTTADAPKRWWADFTGGYTPSRVTSDASFQLTRSLSYVAQGTKIYAFDNPVTGSSSPVWSLDPMSLGSTFTATPSPVPTVADLKYVLANGCGPSPPSGSPCEAAEKKVSALFFASSSTGVVWR